MATALTRYFFGTVYHPRNAWAVVRWWESRRLPASGAGPSPVVKLVSVDVNVAKIDNIPSLTLCLPEVRERRPGKPDDGTH